ncbi:hypothetical protein KGQ19_27975 [Catenulispora sp. NL8]|uniref:ESX-1 secretion-associated protein n=1 Tax=Catenulispora pinistramenti TaxID=2705254 RepID=A0ABS5KXD0_9ACTN|nr:hypothetical protein [Catenulispora pinistramenti]MBS2550716.1 hypothetical protein [Catenulispora pinistramenti]
MADLALNSEALTGFAGTLRNLMGDFSQPIHPTAVCTDLLNDDLGMLSSTDKSCGDGLSNYLNTLASLSDTAAAAAQKADAQLAQQAKNVHGGPVPK